MTLLRPGGRLAVAALCLVLAACGGGGGGGSADDDPVLDGGGPRDEQAIARDANLRISDFPDEWRATPVPTATSAASEASDNAFADCMGRPRPDTRRVAIAYSEDFNAQDRHASSSVQVVRSAEIAQDDFAALRGEKAAPCLKERIDAEYLRQLGPGAMAQTTIERVDLPSFGDESLAYRVQANTLVQGTQARTYLDLTYVRKGNIQMSAVFINPNTPFPTELERSLLQRMVGRA